MLQNGWIVQVKHEYENLGKFIPKVSNCRDYESARDTFSEYSKRLQHWVQRREPNADLDTHIPDMVKWDGTFEMSAGKDTAGRRWQVTVEPVTFDGNDIVVHQHTILTKSVQ